MLSLVILAASFLRHRAEKQTDKQTDRQMAVKPTPATAVGVGNPPSV